MVLEVFDFRVWFLIIYDFFRRRHYIRNIVLMLQFISVLRCLHFHFWLFYFNNEKAAIAVCINLAVSVVSRLSLFREVK